MIKINLLPIRAAKKKETAIQQLVIAGVSVAVIVVVVLSLYFVKRVQVSEAKNDINTSNEKIVLLKAKIGKLEELKNLKEQVKKKLDVLAQLRKNKTGPARRLATLSELTPEQLWLTNYNETGQDVKISGIAFTEELIAQYMKSLEGSNDFMSVELLVSEQTLMGDLKLKKFDMSMKLESSSPQLAGVTAEKK